jgi:hypothetical protein
MRLERGNLQRAITSREAAESFQDFIDQAQRPLDQG